jgi:hypothetical protein
MSGRLMADPATAVLIHGAFHGPWCWERVTSLRTLPRQAVN